MFCNEVGIEHQLTAPYTPQQNGVSERRNRYIMDRTRCMLHEKNLPKFFGLKLPIQQYFYKTDSPPRQSRIKLHLKHGMGTSPP